MDKQQEMEKRLMALSEELGYCGAFRAMLHWDSATMMPRGGAQARARLNGYLAKVRLRTQTGPEAMELLDYFSDHEPSNDIQKAVIRELRYSYDEGRKLGTEWTVRFSQLTSLGKSKWVEAREKDDFSIFEPILKETFDLAREKGRLMGTEHPMEAFINEWDRGITVKNTDAWFTELREGIVDILKQVKDTGKDFDDSLIMAPLDKAALARLGQTAAKAMGYKAECGGFFETVHPFASPIAATDARISTNYSNFNNAIYSTIHEGGHSIYQQCVPPELEYTNLRSGWPGSLHESQSRFYENIIGKSWEFIQWFTPMIHKELPEFRPYSAREIYEMVNRVKPGLTRMTADELSYCLHPILRFELEKQLMDGSLEVKDLPEAWNEKSRSYLGVVPEHLKDGVLQDMQWAIGALGFFQSYSLGNLIDGQLREALLRDVPDAFEGVKNGQFMPITNWLNEHIHKYQKVYLPLDIIRNATGRELSVKPYVDYLRAKYGDLYGF